MNKYPTSDMDRAVGGLDDAELRRGKRLVRWSVVGIVLLATGLMLFSVMLIETAKRLQGQL